MNIVYFIQAGKAGPIKVGTTHSLVKREDIRRDDLELVPRIRVRIYSVTKIVIVDSVYVLFWIPSIERSRNLILAEALLNVVSDVKGGPNLVVTFLH